MVTPKLSQGLGVQLRGIDRLLHGGQRRHLLLAVPGHALHCLQRIEGLLRPRLLEEQALVLQGRPHSQAGARRGAAAGDGDAWRWAHRCVAAQAWDHAVGASGRGLRQAGEPRNKRGLARRWWLSSHAAEAPHEVLRPGGLRARARLHRKLRQRAGAGRLRAWHEVLERTGAVEGRGRGGAAVGAAPRALKARKQDAEAGEHVLIRAGAPLGCHLPEVLQRGACKAADARRAARRPRIVQLPHRLRHLLRRRSLTAEAASHGDVAAEVAHLQAVVAQRWPGDAAQVADAAGAADLHRRVRLQALRSRGRVYARRQCHRRNPLGGPLRSNRHWHRRHSADGAGRLRRRRCLSEHARRRRAGLGADRARGHGCRLRRLCTGRHRRDGGHTRRRRDALEDIGVPEHVLGIALGADLLYEGGLRQQPSHVSEA
mmetsp:Transcript_2652/g.6866  ORF Transcript_2652/g.6866 Transcript_2652/m.6866 type:complete len:429 (-) Transcript_2652:217-1503(-)